MKKEKRLRFTCIDLFVVILLLVVGATFVGKGYLVSLIQNEKETATVSYSLSLSGETPPEVGAAVFTAGGRSLGVITQVLAGPGDELWLCYGEVPARWSENGYLISTDTLLKQGESLVIQCDGREYSAVLIEIKEI